MTTQKCIKYLKNNFGKHLGFRKEFKRIIHDEWRIRFMAFEGGILDSIERLKNTGSLQKPGYSCTRTTCPAITTCQADGGICDCSFASKQYRYKKPVAAHA